MRAGILVQASLGINGQAGIPATTHQCLCRRHNVPQTHQNGSEALCVIFGELRRIRQVFLQSSPKGQKRCAVRNVSRTKSQFPWKRIDRIRIERMKQRCDTGSSVPGTGTSALRTA